ncbi:MAG: hypothetical protein WA432_05115 [Candidatus Babeliaceae bacterium]
MGLYDYNSGNNEQPSYPKLHADSSPFPSAPPASNNPSIENVCALSLSLLTKRLPQNCPKTGITYIYDCEKQTLSVNKDEGSTLFDLSSIKSIKNNICYPNPAWGSDVAVTMYHIKLATEPLQNKLTEAEKSLQNLQGKHDRAIYRQGFCARHPKVTFITVEYFFVI